MIWTDRLLRWRARPSIAYSIAVGCVFVATATRLALDPLLGNQVPFITYFPAVLLASLLAGLRPGLLAVGLSGLAAWYLFLPPRFSFSFGSLDMPLTMLFCGLAAAMVGGAAVINALVERLLEQERMLVAAQRKEAERQRLVISELEHRTRNLFGLVETLARRSFREGSVQTVRDDFLGRLGALQEAYRLEGLEAQPLAAVLGRLLQMHGDRIRIKGCDIRLSDSALQELTLIAHELHTNAMKHGALSDEAGRVLISGDTLAEANGPVFRFVWQETGGPTTAPPETTGFGQTILRRAPEYAGAKVSIEYEPAGLRYSYSNRLSTIERGDR